MNEMVPLASYEARRAADGPGSQGDAWAHPDTTLLGTGRRPAPDFPVALLGQFWAKWTEDNARAASAPPDFVAASLLAAVGALLANVRWALAGAGWSEPPVLWVAAVGAPSSGKSPAIDAVTTLLRHVEDASVADFDSVLRQHDTANEAADVRRELWAAAVKAAIKAGDEPPALPADAVAPCAPVRPRIVVHDATTEKLALLAAGLPRGFMVLRDELAGWIAGLDRYNGGGGADRGFALEMYGGRGHSVERVKHPEPIKIRHLSIGVVGGVQPDKVALVTGGADDGLAARFLWAWPDAIPEFSLCRDRGGGDAGAEAAFHRIAGLRMGEDQHGVAEPIRLRLTSLAEDVLEQFAREADRIGRAATGLLAGALGKARGHALRLACILEHLWWSASPDQPEPAAISDRAILAAAGLLDAYFIPMAGRVFADASIPPVERAAMTLARHLKELGMATFNARDARRSIGGVLREAAAMDAAGGVLVEAGLIRPQPTRAGGGAGRPMKIYEVHPVVIGGRAS